MKYVFLIFSIFTFFFPFHAYAAASDPHADHSTIQIDSPTPILRFNAEHYGNSGFKVLFFGPSKQEPFKRDALQATKANMAQCSEEFRKTVAYTRTLHKLEQSNLLQKPFKKWRLNDIKQINAWLTDLHPKVATPGEFRTLSPRPRVLREFTEDEIARIHVLHTRPSEITDADRKSLTTHVHFFPKPSFISYTVTSMLVTIKEALFTLEDNLLQQQEHAEMSIIGLLHHHLRAVRPWPKCNKTTARILGHVICMQHGIVPPTFEDEKAYITHTNASLVTNDYALLTGYIRNTIIERQQRMATAHRDAALSQ